MQGKLIHRCTHFLGGKVNTRRMSQPDMESIFNKTNLWNILVVGNYWEKKAKFRKNTAAKKHKAVLREMTFLNECANCCFFRASVTQQILIFYVFLGAPCKYTRKIGYTFLARVDIKFTMSRFSIFKEKFYTFRKIQINK